MYKNKEIMIISYTEEGSRQSRKLCRYFKDTGRRCSGYTMQRFAEKYELQNLPVDIKEWIGQQWGNVTFLFISATGIAVRYIAHWLEDKYTDSAVIVMDEKGQYVIPLVAGHIGGGVELAEEIAGFCGGEAVITTATDVQNKFAVDVFACRHGFTLSDRELAKQISAAVLEQKKIGLYSKKPIDGLPEEIIFCSSPEELRQYEAGIVIESRAPVVVPRDLENRILYLRPIREIVVGVGCRKGADKKQLGAGLMTVLRNNGIHPQEVKAFASIDLKREEQGILELAEAYGVPFYTFSVEALKQIEDVSAGSEFVEKTTGVDNVCERAAKCLCPSGKVIQPKICCQGATFSFVEKEPEEHCERILIFAGTTEGRQLAAVLQYLPVELFVSTATEYGGACVKTADNIHVMSGRMDADQMRAFIVSHQISLVIDATHPFAVAVTANIQQACGESQTEYIRCLREEGMSVSKADGIVWVDSVKEAVAFLKGTQGNIFITTGSKELELYTEIPQYKERCYARVLSSVEAVTISAGLGFAGTHLIAMQGPFSGALNTVMLRETKAAYFVTKESGQAGGFQEKVDAAEEAGVTLVVIGRPKEQGKSLKETIEYVKRRYRTDSHLLR